MFIFHLDPYPVVKAVPNGHTETRMSEAEKVGKDVVTFSLEAFKFEPADVKANVSLEIIDG
jgi:hypothetical protein